MDNIKSCGFIQMMEQRLENVIAEAQEKVEDSYGTLSVEVVFKLNLKTKFDKWLIFRGLITPFLWGVVCWIWIYSLFVFEQILNTYQTGNSLAVTLVYVVWNGSTPLNGTVSSGLFNQLTAELVGYFLFFPPLIIAERKFQLVFTAWCCIDLLHSSCLHVLAHWNGSSCLFIFESASLFSLRLQFWLIQNTFSKDA